MLGRSEDRKQDYSFDQPSYYQCSTCISFTNVPHSYYQCPICISFTNVPHSYYQCSTCISFTNAPHSYYQCPTCTVGTPYNKVPYITGSNIARLVHDSQNLWSKLWIPIVKSAAVRVIFMWRSAPKRRIHGSSNLSNVNTIEAEARLPVVLPFRRHCHLSLIWHNKHYVTLWHSIHGQESLIDSNYVCLLFIDTWAHRHWHPMVSCLQARWTRSMLPK